MLRATLLRLLPKQQRCKSCLNGYYSQKSASKSGLVNGCYDSQTGLPAGWSPIPGSTELRDCTKSPFSYNAEKKICSAPVYIEINQTQFQDNSYQVLSFKMNLYSSNTAGEAATGINIKDEDLQAFVEEHFAIRVPENVTLIKKVVGDQLIISYELGSANADFSLGFEIKEESLKNEYNGRLVAIPQDSVLKFKDDNTKDKLQFSIDAKKGSF